MKKMKKIIKYLLVIMLLAIAFICVYNTKIETKINSYIEEEILSSIKKIKKNTNLNTISIGFITDLHVNEEEENLYLNNINAFTEISNTGLLDLSISGGDLFYGTWQNRNEGKVNLKYTKLLFDDIRIPMLYVRGNHDCNIKANASKAISNEDYYKIMLKQLENEVVFNDNSLYEGYYYKDIEKHKIRVCVLNAFNGENYQYIFGDNQLEFIANNMLNFENKENPEEWQVIFFTHTIEDSKAHSSSVEDKEEFYNILTAYKNNTLVEINNSIIDYSKGKNGKIIAIVTGHHHIDLTSYENNFLIITTRSASAMYDREYSYEAVKDTKDELSFDVLTIDPR